MKEEKNASRLVKDGPEMKGCRMYAVRLTTIVAVPEGELEDRDNPTAGDVARIYREAVAARADVRDGDESDGVEVLDVTDTLEECAEAGVEVEP